MIPILTEKRRDYVLIEDIAAIYIRMVDTKINESRLSLSRAIDALPKRKDMSVLRLRSPFFMDVLIWIVIVSSI